MAPIVIGMGLAMTCAVSMAAAQANVATLRADDRRHLLKDRFTEYRTVDCIPVSVQREYAKTGPASVADGPAFDKGKQVFRMANPGAPFQAGDAIQDPTLPWSRLIFTAVSKNYCVLTYETGGFAHFQTAALYRLSGKSAKLVWKTNSRAKNLNELRAQVAKGK